MNRRNFLQLASLVSGVAIVIDALGKAQPASFPMPTLPAELAKIDAPGGLHLAGNHIDHLDGFDLDLLSRDDPTAFYAMDDKRAWAGFEDGTVYRTLDGGASWTQLFTVEYGVQ